MGTIHRTINNSLQEFTICFHKLSSFLTPNTIDLIPINRRSTLIPKHKSKQTSYKSIGEKEGKIIAQGGKKR